VVVGAFELHRGGPGFRERRPVIGGGRRMVFGGNIVVVRGEVWDGVGLDGGLGSDMAMGLMSLGPIDKLVHYFCRFRFLSRLNWVHDGDFIHIVVLGQGNRRH
jgi:hypothetical protein